MNSGAGAWPTVHEAKWKPSVGFNDQAYGSPRTTKKETTVPLKNGGENVLTFVSWHTPGDKKQSPRSTKETRQSTNAFPVNRPPSPRLKVVSWRAFENNNLSSDATEGCTLQDTTTASVKGAALPPSAENILGSAGTRHIQHEDVSQQSPPGMIEPLAASNVLGTNQLQTESTKNKGGVIEAYERATAQPPHDKSTRYRMKSNSIAENTEDTLPKSSQRMLLQAGAKPMSTMSEVRASPRPDLKSGHPPKKSKNMRYPYSKFSPKAHQFTQSWSDTGTDLQRAQQQAAAGLNQRRRAKLNDKHATTSVDLLHSLRVPLDAEQEDLTDARVTEYRELGECPSSWTAEQVEQMNKPAQRKTSANQLKEEVPRKSASPKRCEKLPENEWATPEQFRAQQEARRKTHGRSSRWATKSDTKVEPVKADSNAWGSVDVNATSSDAAVEAIHDKASEGVAHDDVDPGLVGFDGKMMAPPAEWDRREQMRPSRITFKSDNCQERLDYMFRQRFPDQKEFSVIPTEFVLNSDNHADGFTMTPRNRSITAVNTSSYYDNLGAADLRALNGFQRVSDYEFDQEVIAPGIRQDYRIQSGYRETTEWYCSRYQMMQKRTLPAQQASEEQPAAPVVQMKEPTLNIYLRPATVADLAQVAGIYNYYIRSTTYPTNLDEVTDADMKEVLEDAINNKLPFLVAVSKQARNRRRRSTANAPYQALNDEEEIVGFASAQDWTAPHFCERIAAEIEIYIALQHRMQGIGACLMDKMIQICDPGYVRKGAYQFTCTPEKNHLFSEGGARDLHKMYVCLRTWSRPAKTPASELVLKKSDREDECELWLKAWLESWGFEQEGHLREVGARKGR